MVFSSASAASSFALAALILSARLSSWVTAVPSWGWLAGSEDADGSWPGSLSFSRAWYSARAVS